MKHGSLFSGIGGFDLAAEWMGWENVFHCEWNEFGQKVLKYHFPNADSYGDITQTDFTKYEGTIDIISGGFPCQPFSTAGQRKGTDDERYLWGEMLRAIQEIKPEYVVAENVFGITTIDGGLVFEQVCIDLENQGYEVQPFIIPSASKNAPHRRERVWFVAQNAMFRRCLHGEHDQKRTSVGEFRNTGTRSTNGVCVQTGIASNTEFKPTGSDGGTNNETQRDVRRSNESDVLGTFCSDGDATNSDGIGLRGESDGLGESGFVNKNSAGNDWIHFPTQPPICGGDDGLPTELDGITLSKWRKESLKAYGNAIVPQVAYEIFKSIQATNENMD